MKTKIQNKITLAKRVGRNLLRLLEALSLLIAGGVSAHFGLFNDLSSVIQYSILIAAAVALGTGLYQFLKFLNKE